MNILINLEDLLRYVIGCTFGITFVLWIIKNIMPFGHTQTGGGGGFLLFLLALFIMAPIVQNTFSGKSPLTIPDKKEEISKPDNDTILAPKKEQQEFVKAFVNISPSVDTFVNVSPSRDLFFVQISSGSSEDAAYELAEEYEHLSSHVGVDDDKFIVVVSDGFKTKNAARIFRDLHKSVLPDGAFIVELTSITN